MFFILIIAIYSDFFFDFTEDFDCYLTAIFYKGLFFRLKGKLNEAKKLLEQILNE